MEIIRDKGKRRKNKDMMQLTEKWSLGSFLVINGQNGDFEDLGGSHKGFKAPFFVKTALQGGYLANGSKYNNMTYKGYCMKNGLGQGSSMVAHLRIGGGLRLCLPRGLHCCSY